MNKDKYSSVMDKIQATQSFKTETLQLLENIDLEDKKGERKKIMNKNTRIIGALAGCAVIAFAVFTMLPKTTEENQINPPRIVENNENQGTSKPPMGKVAVNIEGKIVEVSEDGKSFKLDSGQWVITDDKTVMGTSLPTSPPKEDQLIEPTYRIGNSIAGFTQDDTESDKVYAYSIYTNWNWDDPIK